MAVISLLIFPVIRDRNGAGMPLLWGYFLLSCVYGAYICIRALAAGAGATEPILDTLTVVLIPGLVYWVVRTPVRLNLKILFQLVVISLVLVLLATLVERYIFDVRRPELLLGNPFNLAPLLFLPLFIATMDTLAPSRIWVWLGLIAATMTLFVLGGLVQTRGLFIGAVLLWILRAVFMLTEPPDVRTRLWAACRMLLPLFLAGALVFANGEVFSRYKAAANIILTQDSTKEWSTDLRYRMIEAGIRAGKERPYFGYGPQHRFDAALPDPETFPKRFSHLHNDFVTHWVAGGVPAVVLLTALLMYPAIAGFTRSVGQSRNQLAQARGFGVLTSCALLGTAAANNVFFTDISAYSTSLTIVWSLVFIEVLKGKESSDAS
ncbi:O-antigen ligase family protein [Roseobacter cerasinus]|uniref:O-antigen ligase family protein n=1 Tax=Roseobacter cerasinus TaxID=2602289 RepID=UPI001EEA0378|nr:O-antigen ligase family protein [Roseobacter cerasinus]